MSDKVSAEAPAPGIVERLREWAECGPNVLLEGASADLEVAADTITALCAEMQGWKNVNKLLASQVEAQRREVEWLWAALENAAGLLMWCADAKPGIDTQKGREVARAFAEQIRADLKEPRT